MEHVEKNKHINPKKSKGIEHLELGRRTMDFGTFIKTGQTLADPKSAPSGSDSASMQGGDSNLSNFDKATNSLTENVKELLKTHSKEDVVKMVQEMEETPEAEDDDVKEDDDAKEDTPKEEEEEEAQTK